MIRYHEKAGLLRFEAALLFYLCVILVQNQEW